jgi:hypothetical protein
LHVRANNIGVRLSGITTWANEQTNTIILITLLSVFPHHTSYLLNPHDFESFTCDAKFVQTPAPLLFICNTLIFYCHSPTLSTSHIPATQRPTHIQTQHPFPHLQWSRSKASVCTSCVTVTVTATESTQSLPLRLATLAIAMKSISRQWMASVSSS